MMCEKRGKRRRGSLLNKQKAEPALGVGKVIIGHKYLTRGLPFPLKITVALSNDTKFSISLKRSIGPKMSDSDTYNYE